MKKRSVTIGSEEEAELRLEVREKELTAMAFESQGIEEAPPAVAFSEPTITPPPDPRYTTYQWLDNTCYRCTQCPFDSMGDAQRVIDHYEQAHVVREVIAVTQAERKSRR
jgi:hypothetical protein